LVSFSRRLTRAEYTLRPESGRRPSISLRQRRLHRVLSSGSSPTCGEAGARSLWAAECVWLSSQKTQTNLARDEKGRFVPNSLQLSAKIRRAQ
jgi:hypothetical protein